MSKKPITMTDNPNEKLLWLQKRCRQAGLKVTPQRIAVYKTLLETRQHPSAEMLHQEVQKVLPTISFDTVNRTLLTLAELGAASVVEGSGDSKRFDGDTANHQHFRCIKGKKIVDFHYKPFENIKVPANIRRRFRVLRKTVYLEGICDACLRDE